MIKSGLDPIRKMGEKGTFTGGKPIPELVDMMDTIELFADSFDKFIGVFDQAYSGGDFCAGLTFGMQGMKMLEKVATTLYNNHLKSKAQEARSHANGKKQTNAMKDALGAMNKHVNDAIDKERTKSGL